MRHSSFCLSGHLTLCCLGLGLLFTPACQAGPGNKSGANTNNASQSNTISQLKEAVLAEFDTDSNGKLSRKERSQFIKAMRSGTIQSESLNTMLLENFDRNSNGTLDRKEIASMRRRPNNRPNNNRALSQFGNGANQFGANNRGNGPFQGNFGNQLGANANNGFGPFGGTGLTGEGAQGEGGMCEGRPEGSGEAGALNGQGRRGGNGAGGPQFRNRGDFGGGQAFSAGTGNGGPRGGGAAFGGGRGGGRGGRGR